MNARASASQFTSAAAYPFLRLLYSPYTDCSGLCCEIRCLRPKHQKGSGSPPRAWFPLTDAGLAQTARRASVWAGIYDVYMGVLPRTPGGGKAIHVPVAASLWADVDGSMVGLQGAKQLIRVACRE